MFRNKPRERRDEQAEDEFLEESGLHPEASRPEQELLDEAEAGRQTMPLGMLLVERGLLTEEQLAFALAEQERMAKPLGQVLVDLGFVPETTVAQALATQHGGVIKTEFGFATGFGGGSVFRSGPGGVVTAVHPDDLLAVDEAQEPPVTNGAPEPEDSRPKIGLVSDPAPHPEESRPTIGLVNDPPPVELPTQLPVAIPAELPTEDPVEGPAHADVSDARLADFEARLEATASRVEQLERELTSASDAQETLRAEILRLATEAGPDRDLQDRLYRARLVELEQRIDSVLAQLETRSESGGVR